MNFTPDRIENIMFCKAFRGYNKNQVDGVMSKVIEDYKKSTDELAKLKEHVAILDETIKKYKAVEEAMQRCLLIAQRTSDEMTIAASEKSKTIVSDAETSAANLMDNAHQEISKLKFSFNDAKSRIYTFKAQTEGLLTAQLDVLKQLSISVDSCALPD